MKRGAAAPFLPPLSAGAASPRAAPAPSEPPSPAQSMLRRPPLPLPRLLPLPPRPPPARPREAASITHKAALPVAASLGDRSPARRGRGLLAAAPCPLRGGGIPARGPPGPEAVGMWDGVCGGRSFWWV